MSRAQRRRQPAPTPASGYSQPIQLTIPWLNLVTESQIEQIHEASLTILARTGLIFNGPAALRLFRQAGVRVEGQRVYLEWDFIERCLALAPAEYTLHARNPVNTVTIGGRQYLTWRASAGRAGWPMSKILPASAPCPP
jgi:trimethylamine:corrinoid methyltransferase-like protein